MTILPDKDDGGFVPRNSVSPFNRAMLAATVLVPKGKGIC